MVAPETKYTQIGEASIGYQTVGQGPIDLVFVSGLASNIETMWDFPPFARILQRMASYARLILFDARGSGISDPLEFETLPTWEHWSDDLRAVLDAAGSERTAILAQFDGGMPALMFAATHPDRTTALILWSSQARGLLADDYPIGVTAEAAEEQTRALQQLWGTTALVSIIDPNLDESLVNQGAKYLRTIGSPRRVAAMSRYTTHLDARAVLPSIRVPTFVLHRRDNNFIPTQFGRYIADNIPGARFMEIPGRDMDLFGEGSEEIQDLIEEFLTGARRPVEVDRPLATVLFTDIVDSTGRAASLGDRKWKELLTKHDETARSEVERMRGNFVNTTGDGVLATFDGPGRAIRCAHALARALLQDDIAIRAGLHTGEIELREGGNVGGIAVHIAARVMAEAGPGELICSRTVKDLVAGSDFVFEDRGLRALKGVPDEWQLYAVRQS
jgi:class 3 adenylate cyclase